MIRSFRVLLFSIFFASCMALPLSAELLPRSVSTSRQFIVLGPDAALRGKICGLAEQTKKSLLTLLQQADEWKTPVVVNAQRPQANLPEARPAELNFSQTGFGLKLQLDLHELVRGHAIANAQRRVRRIFESGGALARSRIATARSDLGLS
jgi:hypothetical protein